MEVGGVSETQCTYSVNVTDGETYLKTEVAQRCPLVAGYHINQVHAAGRRQRIHIQLQMHHCASLYAASR